MAEPSEQQQTVEQPTEQPTVVEDAPVAAPAEASDDNAKPDEDIKSKKVTLADLSAKGTALYAHKNFEEAAEIFSEASVLQAEINGEMAPENAEILFHYGRSLFRVGQSKSDVLGATAGGDKPKNASSKPKPKPSASKPATTDSEKVTEEGVALVAEKKEGETIQEAAAKKEANDAGAPKKPLFQFTGDENFDEDSDEEDVSCRNSPERGCCM